MRRTCLFCLMAALVCGASPVTGLAASTWHVAPTGSDANNGTSWAQAWATISNAVAQAVSNDTILVSNGTYLISAEILLNNTALTIQGYMNGTVGGLSVASNTIVRRGAAGSNAPQHRIFNIPAGTGSNVLDGLTITNGYLSGASGGGIYGGARNMTIRNCIVAGNTALGGAGGGIYFYNNSFGTITNCIVAGNYAHQGGGIELSSMALTDVRNCLIRHNTSTNVADWNRGGGGIDIVLGNGAGAYDCTIVSNRSGGYGGGVFCYCSGATAIIIDRCLIQGNIASYGGGVELRENPGPSVIVRNSRIIGNTAKWGGGIELSDGGGTMPIILNTLIADNVASNIGGAVYGRFAMIQNCTAVRNLSLGTYGGIYLINTGLVTNVVAYLNSPDTSTGFPLVVYNSCMPALNHGANGNTTNDPQFMVSSANGDYRLRPNSPCINTGTNQAWMINALDVAGTRRLDILLPPIVDMGAYEFHPAGAMFSGR